MEQRSETVFLRWVAGVFLTFAVVSVGIAVGVERNVQRIVLLAFAVGMYVGTMAVLLMIKSLIDHCIKAEENEKARQSDERKHKMEIDRSEREAERIRAMEARIIVIVDRNDD